MSGKTKRDLDGMEARRRKGMGLLAQGVSQAEVARQCGVSRVSALRWEQQRKAAKAKAWQRRPLGRRPKLTTAHKQTLEKALEQGAQAHGFLNDLWTLPRVPATSGFRIRRSSRWCWRNSRQARFTGAALAKRAG
jgi:transposase